MGASGAANVIFRKEIQAAKDPAAKRAEIIAHYENLLYNPYIAASRGFVDQVIMPRETRPRLIAALETLAAKREVLPAKKHGNIPV
jgi:acetyl-CoA carboxylase carboxyltransferase component